MAHKECESPLRVVDKCQLNFPDLNTEYFLKARLQDTLFIECCSWRDVLKG